MIEQLVDTAGRLRDVRAAYEHFLALHAVDELTAAGTDRLGADVREHGGEEQPPRFLFPGGPLDD